MSDDWNRQYNTILDDESKKILVNAMKEIEKRTGKEYELSIEEVGKNSATVYSFDDKGPFTVKMSAGYEELDGEYKTVSDIERKINQLIKSSYPKVDKCPECGSDVEDDEYGYYCTGKKCSYNYQVKTLGDKWWGIRVSLKFKQIYFSSGGSISAMIEKGKVDWKQH